jgi:hypothetical protein
MVLHENMASNVYSIHIDVTDRSGPTSSAIRGVSLGELDGLLKIDSVHFVSLDVLLSPQARTYEYINTSRRLHPKAHPWVQKFLHMMLGDMKFSAIKLRPTESVPPESRNLQLHLWGLTLGIISLTYMILNDRCINRLPGYPSWESPLTS